MSRGVHLSIGMDVGTTTYHWTVHRLAFGVEAGGTSRHVLREGRPVARSPVRLTPFCHGDVLDEETIRRTVEADLLKVGLRPQDLETGSVIITGMAARRRNAPRLIASLSALFPRLVSTVAGARLESILAARGAGADLLSRRRLTRVLNVDIGGGTTNLALYDCGRLVGSACLALGARLVHFDREGRVLSWNGEVLGKILRPPPALPPARVDDDLLGRMGEKVVEALWNFLKGGDLPGVVVEYDEMPRRPVRFDTVSFTGGVGALLKACRSMPLTRFNDLGVSLARAVRERFGSFPLHESNGDSIRATSVGASVHLVQVAGRSVHVTAVQDLPLRGLPAISVRLGEAADSRPFRMDPGLRPPCAYAVRAGPGVTLEALKELADRLLGEVLTGGARVLVVVFDQDLGKIFGRIVQSRPDWDPALRVVSIDSVELQDGEIVDIGAPTRSGLLPVTVKTLHF